MREIKIRAYAVEEMVNDQWLCGFGFSFIEFAEHYAKEKGRKGDYWLYTEHGDYLVYGESVGQYTGLKTKSGVEVYEGDILSLQAHQDHFVEFYSGEFVGRSTNKVQRINWMATPLWKLIEMSYEVIGNIYESPIKE